MKPDDVADGQLCLVRRTSGDTGPAYRRSEVFQQKDVRACLGANVAIVTGRSWQRYQVRDLLIGTDFSFISKYRPRTVVHLKCGRGKRCDYRPRRC
jgi:hypothetical protein